MNTIEKQVFIFLDIDGVLTTPQTEFHELDVVLVENLKQLIQKTNARLVISSSRRHNMENVKTVFDKYGLCEFIHDCTPVDIQCGLRGREIDMWIVNNLYPNVEDCARIAIDDDSFDMGRLIDLGRFIKTDTNTGLSSAVLNECLLNLERQCQCEPYFPFKL